MAHRLTPAATVLLVAAILVPAPVTANHLPLIEDGVATFLEPAFDPFLINPLPGDRLALTADSVLTLNDYVTPDFTATQTVGITGTTGGMFWEFIPGGGWRADVRQADGTISVSISYVALDGIPVAYPADAQGIGFTTGLTDEQLLSLVIDGTIQLRNGSGDTGLFNFSNENLVRDVTGRALLYIDHEDLIPTTPGVTFVAFVQGLLEARLSMSLDPIDPLTTDVYEVFAPNTFGIVRIQSIPIPAVAWLFPAGLIAGVGWMKRRSG